MLICYKRKLIALYFIDVKVPLASRLDQLYSNPSVCVCSQIGTVHSPNAREYSCPVDLQSSRDQKPAFPIHGLYSLFPVSAVGGAYVIAIYRGGNAHPTPPVFPVNLYYSKLRVVVPAEKRARGRCLRLQQIIIRASPQIKTYVQTTILTMYKINTILY